MCEGSLTAAITTARVHDRRSRSDGRGGWRSQPSSRTVNCSKAGIIAAHNAPSAPFIWTKTADEILASIARFAQRTVKLQQAP